MKIKRSLIVAPHADDELLGPGGSALKRKSEGVELAWLLVTCPGVALGWSKEQKFVRQQELKIVTQLIGFDKFYELNFESTELDIPPLNSIILNSLILK